MLLADYIKENNLPDFIDSWEQVSDLTGTDLNILLAENEPALPAIAAPIVADIAPKKAKVATTPASGLEAIIAAAIAPYINFDAPVLDEKKVIDLIKKYAPVKQIDITNNGTKITVPASQHEKFETVLKMVSAGVNPYLYGEAGTGKTQLAENVSIALGLNFYCISVCAQSTKSDLLGFIGATGNYISSLFRQAYENGGMFLIDEIDNGNPNVLAVLNAALANGYCAFPDGMVKRHEKFTVVAAANTFGTGADRKYIGRNQLDASTLNRFVQEEITYDEKLEISIFGEATARPIQAIRKKMKGERVIISMRNISNALKLQGVGYSLKESIQMAVINTIPANLHSKL